ncbi:MAG: tetratricopeptide repeat protein [Deltaproteobacteria bacterium]|nr:tetratricopeptide repeat protein [Deltaproteobacteria bacterium]
MHSRLSPLLVALLLSAVLLCLGTSPSHAETPKDDGGVRLVSVDLSIGGLPVTVRAGGVASVHPDAPFRVLGAKSDSWLNMGLSYRLAGFPEVDLKHYHTLSKLLGPRLYSTDSLELEVLKNGQKIGSVGLLVRLLPIDWLRRAAKATELSRKIQFTERALELNPDDPLMIERLADLYAEAGRFSQAAELLSSHGRSQQDPRWLERLANLYIAAGQKEQAAAALSKLVALHTGDQVLIERLAQLYEDLGRWEEAATLLEKLSNLQSGADKADTLTRLSKAQESGGQNERALASLEKAVLLDSSRPELWQELARLRGGTGDKKGALQALERAAALSPKNRALHLELSQAFQAAGDKAKAALEMEKVAAMDPQNPAPLLNLATQYEQSGNRKALAGVYKRLAKLQPDDPDLAYNLAVLAMEDDKPALALQYLATVEKARPGDADVGEIKLRLLLSLERWGQALETAAQLLKQKPQDLDLWLSVLDQLVQTQPVMASELLEQVLAKNPKSVRLFKLKAAMALEDKRPEDAIAALNKAVELGPKDLKLKFQLAGLLEAEDRDPEALKAYEAILDADPNFPQAEERYLSVRTRLLRHSNSSPSKQ